LTLIRLPIRPPASGAKTTRGLTVTLPVRSSRFFALPRGATSSWALPGPSTARHATGATLRVLSIHMPPFALNSTVRAAVPAAASRSIRMMRSSAGTTVTLWPAAPHSVAAGSLLPSPE
jgi:hypothetical protein